MNRTFSYRVSFTIRYLDDINFLGLIKTTNGDCTEEIKKRIAYAKEKRQVYEISQMILNVNESHTTAKKEIHELNNMASVYRNGAESCTLPITDANTI